MMRMDDSEIEIDLIDLLAEFWNHKIKIFMITLLMGVVFAVGSISLITPLYSSTAQLYVLSKSTSITSLADIQVGSNLSTDYLVVVKSRPVLESVIKKLNLQVEGQSDFEAYKELKDRVTVTNASDRIIEITVKDENSENAKIIVNTLAEEAAVYIGKKMNQDEPSIILDGYSDGKKVSPNNTKNALLGIMVGFAISAGTVMVKFLLNDTIKTEADMESLGVTVLGSLPLDVVEDDGEKTKRGKKRKVRKKH